MTNTFSPRLRFLKSHKEEAESWALSAKSPAFQNAAVHAFAEMGYAGATQEELKGARDFIGYLTNVGEPLPESEPFKRTTLHQTSRTSTPPQEEKK